MRCAFLFGERCGGVKSTNRSTHSPPPFPSSPKTHTSFVPALNAALAFAVEGGFSHILFLSLEMELPAAAFRRLAAHLDPREDLVVGAALEGHQFKGSKEGEGAQPQPLTGSTSPWNTCALWSVPKLGLTGFLAVSDGLPGDPGVAGIEEVAAIAVAQSLRAASSGEGKGERDGGGMRAKLVNLRGHVAWNVAWDDPARQAWHAKKMESKVRRASAQLAALGLGTGGATVWHVEDAAAARGGADGVGGGNDGK
jgi:hypothetical protein